MRDLRNICNEKCTFENTEKMQFKKKDLEKYKSLKRNLLKVRHSFGLRTPELLIARFVLRPRNLAS